MTSKRVTRVCQHQQSFLSHRLQTYNSIQYNKRGYMRPVLRKVYYDSAKWCSLNAVLWSSVFNLLLQNYVKVSERSRTVGGGEFQVAGPGMAKAWDPCSTSWERGSIRSQRAAERRWSRPICWRHRKAQVCQVLRCSTTKTLSLAVLTSVRSLNRIRRWCTGGQ